MQIKAAIQFFLLVVIAFNLSLHVEACGGWSGSSCGCSGRILGAINLPSSDSVMYVDADGYPVYLGM